jgi:hypothetical protein
MILLIGCLVSPSPSFFLFSVISSVALLCSPLHGMGRELGTSMRMGKEERGARNKRRREDEEYRIKLTNSETSTSTSLFQRAMIFHISTRPEHLPDLTLPTAILASIPILISCIYRHLIPSIISHALFCVYLFIAFERSRLHSA